MNLQLMSKKLYILDRFKETLRLLENPKKREDILNLKVPKGCMASDLELFDENVNIN